MRSWMEVMGVSVSSPSCRSYVRRTRLSNMHTWMLAKQDSDSKMLQAGRHVIRGAPTEPLLGQRLSSAIPLLRSAQRRGMKDGMKGGMMPPSSQKF